MDFLVPCFILTCNVLLYKLIFVIFRYKLLLEELLSCTAKDDGDYKAIEGTWLLHTYNVVHYILYIYLWCLKT